MGKNQCEPKALNRNVYINIYIYTCISVIVSKPTQSVCSSSTFMHTPFRQKEEGN